MHRLLWVLLAVLAIVALLSLTEIPRQMGWWGSSSENGQENDALLHEKSRVSDGAVDDATSSGPVLFGLAREERVGKGTVTGRLMRFGTSDGVARAAVSLRGMGYGKEAVEQSTMSLKDGTFLFSNVPAGENYLLSVASTEGLDAQASGVSVEANQTTEVGTLWLGKKGILEGVVVDGADRPIEGATVEVLRGGRSVLAMSSQMSELVSTLDRDTVALKHTITDRMGRFRVEGLNPGPLILQTRCEGYRIHFKDIVLMSGGAAGGTVHVRLTAQVPLRGRLVDEMGRGIAWGRVACFESKNMHSLFFGRRFAHTKNDGTFVIESPPAAENLSLIATAPGRPTALLGVDTWEGTREFVLEGGVRVTLRLLEWDTGVPVQGAVLSAMCGSSAGTKEGNVVIGSAITDARGEAEFLAEPGELGMLFVSHPHYGRGQFSKNVSQVAEAGNAMFTGPKDMTLKGPETTLEFHVRPGIALSGRVVDPDGNPLAGAKVAAFGDMWQRISSALSNERGEYELKGLNPSGAMLTASAPGYVSSFKAPRRSGTGEPIGSESSEYDIVLVPSAVIQGRVVGPGGKPLGGVHVRMNLSFDMSIYVDVLTGGPSSITNSQGDYTIEGGAEGMEGHVIARCQGFLDARTETFKMTPGADVKAPTLAMRRGREITLYVETPSGEPARGAAIEVDVSAEDDVGWDHISGYSETTADRLSGGDGTAVVSNLPAGTITAIASLPGFASGRASLKLEEGSAEDSASTTQQRLKLKLREVREFCVRVLDEQGDPVKGASVSIHEIADDLVILGRYSSRSAITDKGGNATFADTAQVAIGVWAEREGMRPAEMRAHGSQGSAEIRLTRISPIDAARIKAIDAELKTIKEAYGSAMANEERSKLSTRMVELKDERARLEGVPRHDFSDEVESSCGG